MMTPTSTQSETGISEETTGVAAIIAVNAAKADRMETASQTRLQQEVASMKTNLQISKDCVAGTSASEKKASSAQQIAQNLKASPQLSSRETVKGADECECGDPLLNIHL